MKFGKHLLESAHPAYRNYYIAYGDLKQAIKIITGEVVPSEDDLTVSSPLIERTLRRRRGRTPEAQFQDLIDHELTKVNNFSNVQYLALQEEIRRQLCTADPNAAEGLKKDIIAFEEYIRMNYTGFRKAAKKFDKLNHSNSSSWFMGRVARSEFMAVDIDKLVMGLAMLGLVLRGTERSAPVPAIAAGVIPVFEKRSDGFRRRKYFLRSDQLISVEMALLSQMHAIIGFPTVQTFQAMNTVGKLVDALTNPLVRNPGQPRLSFTEYAVIFERDDKSYSQYSCRRSKRADPSGAAGYEEPVFSVRWNEFQHRQGRCSLVKESHPKWHSGEQSQLQIEISQKDVAGIILGKQTKPSTHPLLTQFSDFISSGQKPSCIYSYKRTLFGQGDEKFFVAIDQDVRFGSLRSVDVSDVFTKLDAVDYHAFLRQRAMTFWVAKDTVQLPEYLDAIVKNSAVTEVASFSKAVHAEAALHVVTEVDRPVTAGLPHWFVYTISEGANVDDFLFALPSADELGIVESVASPNLMSSSGNFDVLPASGKLVLQDYVSGKKESSVTVMSPVLPAAPSGGLDEPLLDRSTTRRGSAGSRSLWDQFKYVFFGSVKPQDIPDPSSSIEPKTFLANERTFLNWSYCAFIISALAVTVKALDPTASVEAAILTVVAIATLVWSLNVYRLRISALRAMKPLDALLVSSTNGASMIALAVAAALAMMWVSRVMAAISNR